MVIEWVAIILLPLPGARVHQCFPALGRSLLESIFCTHISSHVRLSCSCWVTGLKGHSFNFLLSFTLNLGPKESRKRWCWWSASSGRFCFPSQTRYWDQGKKSCWCSRFLSPLSTFANTHLNWGRLQRHISQHYGQHYWRKEAPLQMFSGKEIIGIKSELILYTGIIPAFAGKIWIFSLKEKKDRALRRNRISGFLTGVGSKPQPVCPDP